MRDDVGYREWWHSWLDYCRHQLADIDQRITTTKPFVSLPRADQAFFEPEPDDDHGTMNGDG